MNKICHKITANWSGDYPCLCFGEWTITINGMSLEIPQDKKKEHMGTYGTYSSWHFDDDYLEVFDDYDDGKPFDSWLFANREWIDEGLKKLGISFDMSDYQKLYTAIQEQDFRQGSCGGCI